MNRRSSLMTPSRAWRLALDNSGTTIAASTPRIATTIRISISVKPARRAFSDLVVTGHIVHLSLANPCAVLTAHLLDDGRLAVGVRAPDPAGPRTALVVIDEPHHRPGRRPVDRGGHVALGAAGRTQGVLGDTLHVWALVVLRRA